MGIAQSRIVAMLHSVAMTAASLVGLYPRLDARIHGPAAPWEQRGMFEEMYYRVVPVIIPDPAAVPIVVGLHLRVGGRNLASLLELVEPSLRAEQPLWFDVQ